MSASRVKEPKLREIGPKVFVRRLDALLRVYNAAMHPPVNQLPGRSMIMARHAAHPDFRALIAERRRSPVAFAYGFRGEPGQWWHDAVRKAITDASGPLSAKQWLDHPFEIAEVHVRPDYQGRGIGRRLVTGLCADRPEATIVLSTLDQQTRARGLYRSLGLVDLLTGFTFPGGGPCYAVMGSALPLVYAPSRP